MKISWFLPVALISVTFFTNISEAKTFSINKAIEEELARQKISNTVTTTEATTTGKQTNSKNSAYREIPKVKTLKEVLSEGSEKLTPLKYKKLFQSKLPSKQKRPFFLPRITRKHQSIKRDTNDDDGDLNQKYPLLRRISLLLDNIIASESNEYENDKIRSVTPAETDLCPCARNQGNAADPPETAAASSTVAVTALPPPPAVETKAPNAKTHHPALSYLRRLRQNQKLPLLFARDPASSQRNHHGISKGSSATRHWDLKRNITWNHRTGQHNTQRERGKTNAEANGKHADVDTRNSTSGYKTFRRQLRSRNPADSETAPAARLLQRLEDVDHTTIVTIAPRKNRGNLNQHQIKTQHEVKGDEEKPPELIRGGPQRSSELTQRGSLPANKISNFGQPLQSNEISKNSNVYVSQYFPSYQRIPDGNGTLAGENKGLRKENEAVISLNRSELISFQNLPMNKSVVVIIDGYSVTRSKSGVNKFSEKSIRSQPARGNATEDSILNNSNK